MCRRHIALCRCRKPSHPSHQEAMSTHKVSKPAKSGKTKPAGKKGASPISGSLKDADQRRRQVFKPVLDNPYTQSPWPFVEPAVAQHLLGLLDHVLAQLGQYNRLTQSKSLSLPTKPHIAQHITVGFNSTVGALERQAQAARDQKPLDSYIKYVFVTKYEVTPSVLLNPFPVLTRVASRLPEDQVKLVQLPRGALQRLSEVLHVPHVTIVGLAANVPEARAIYEVVDAKVANVDVPWIEDILALASNPRFSKPVLKVLATSAPILPKKNNQKTKKKGVAQKEQGTKA